MRVAWSNYAFICGWGFLGFASSLIEGFQAEVHVTKLEENSEMEANRKLDRIKTFLVDFIPQHTGAC